MPYKCVVPGCKGNYEKGEKVHVFSFPKDQGQSEKWLKAIKRDNFIPSRHSKVCEFHFKPGDIRWEWSAFNKKTGTRLTAKLERPQLRKGAVPTQLPNCPSSLSASALSKDSTDSGCIRLDESALENSMKFHTLEELRGTVEQRDMEEMNEEFFGLKREIEIKKEEEEYIVDMESAIEIKEEDIIKEEIEELSELEASVTQNSENKMSMDIVFIGEGCDSDVGEQKADKTFWTEFIKPYTDNQCLWKVINKEYLDREKKSSAYSVPVQKLKKDASANQETVTKKMKSMRHSFRKETKKVMGSHISGAGGDDDQQSLWYSDLLFLQDQETPHESLSSVNEELESWSDTNISSDDLDTAEQDELLSTVLQRLSAVPVRPSGSRKRGCPKAADDVLALIGERLQSICQEDEWDIIGRNIAAKLRQLSREQGLFSERLINEILFHGQLNNLSVNSRIVTEPRHTMNAVVAEVHKISTL